MKKLVIAIVLFLVAQTTFASNANKEIISVANENIRVSTPNEKIELKKGFTYTVKKDNTNVEECWITIVVYGPLGEPFGTYTGHSWISCYLAMQYAIDDLIDALL